MSASQNLPLFASQDQPVECVGEHVDLLRRKARFDSWDGRLPRECVGQHAELLPPKAWFDSRARRS